MPTSHQVVEFLAEIGQLTDIAAPNMLETPVTSVSPESDAQEGALSWLSAKRLQRDPGAVQRFRGAVLVCPESAPGQELALHATIARCRNPKLAFIRAVNEFFPHATKVSWPAAAHGAIAADAKIQPGVKFAPGVVISSDVEIGAETHIGPNTCLANVTIGRNVRIGANCTIGLPGFGYEKDENGRYWHFPHLGRVVIGDDVEIGSNTCIDRGALGVTVLKRGVKVDNLVHIAHNVIVEDDSLVIANSMIAGSTRIGPRAWIAPSVSILNQLSIGADTVIGMGAVVLKDVADGSVVVGNPAKPLLRGPKT